MNIGHLFDLIRVIESALPIIFNNVNKNIVDIEKKKLVRRLNVLIEIIEET